MHLALGNVGADSRGCHGVKEDSLLDPGGCFFLSLRVCTQPRRCVWGGGCIPRWECGQGSDAGGRGP